MSAIELLPCPFCGSHGIDRELTRLRPYPYCTNCGASGPIMKVTWNDRTRTDLSQASVAAALEAVAAGLNTPDSNVDKALNMQICCNGDMCGCQGSTVGEYLQYQIRDLITPDQRTALQAAIDAAVAEARAEDAAWHPIETAPRDGTWFLAYSAIPGFDKIRHVHFADAYDRFPINSENIAWSRAPTHWKPLPEIAQIGAKP